MPGIDQDRCRIRTQGRGRSQHADRRRPSAVAKLLDEVGFHLHEKEDEGVQHCPACDQKISDHALLCVFCGYHLETGKFVKGMGGVGPAAQKAEGHEGAALTLLKKAERTIEQDKDEERKTAHARHAAVDDYHDFVHHRVIYRRHVRPAPRPGVSGIGVRVDGRVWKLGHGLLVQAGRHRVQGERTHGLLFLFVPFYALYYVAIRWADCGKLFMTYLILSLLVPVGWMLVLVGPKLKQEPAREVTLAGSHPPAVMSALLDPSRSKTKRKRRVRHSFVTACSQAVLEIPPAEEIR